MNKGERTKTAILEHATGLASQVGLTGLTIGVLADDLELSKSGLFAHFKSKESLQIEVLTHAAQRFSDTVVRPALHEPRGAPRLRALFERWIAWEKDVALPGGCIFVAATTELDDRPGPVRDRLVELQRAWIDVIATSFRKGIDAGLFQRDADPQQFAQDMYGIMLSLHFHRRLMRDREADARARRAFDALLERAAP
ncbi:MAG TPA: TetR/AcrR family transcriptional regulator [Gemmatimonadales bacterium]|nr:TetR/AcrR family transcriptional regulator [Gemmatimonadales bacterium]